MSEDNIVLNEEEDSLPLQSTVNQLKKLRKLTKGIDIGDRISDINKKVANIQYIRNPIDTGIESYEKFLKKNRTSFQPGWNVKHLKPFKDYVVPPTSLPKKKKTKK